MPELYFEDFSVGQSFALGSRAINAEEIIAFAKEYDPQPFHTDEAAARESFFGGLIASGWQTAGIYMRLLADGLLHRTTSQGAPGVDELRWLRPVRPGDTLTGRATVVETRLSKSRPAFGFVRFRHELTNQTGEPVLTFLSSTMMTRRAA